MKYFHVVVRQVSPASVGKRTSRSVWANDMDEAIEKVKAMGFTDVVEVYMRVLTTVRSSALKKEGE